MIRSRLLKGLLVLGVVAGFGSELCAGGHHRYEARRAAFLQEVARTCVDAAGPAR